MTPICTMHESLEHQHPLCPPMGTQAAQVQSWFCCHCGTVGQHAIKIGMQARPTTTIEGHGPLLTIEVMTPSTGGRNGRLR